MNIIEHDFVDLESAASAMAAEMASALNRAIKEDGSARMSVSGGRTPKHVFKHLLPHNIDWKAVTLTLTDERWVCPEHPDSNERLVKEYLMTGKAGAAAFIPLYGGEDSPQAGESACEKRLAALRQPFSAVYLGMGPDGHFASLFPHDSAVDVQDRLCVAVPETDVRLPRMSLTAKAILHAEKLFLLFSGADKHVMYAEAMKKGAYREVPLRLILQQKEVPVSVYKAP